MYVTESEKITNVHTMGLKRSHSMDFVWILYDILTIAFVSLGLLLTLFQAVRML